MRVIALVAFVPIAAQNTPTAQTAPVTAKRGTDLEDQ